MSRAERRRHDVHLAIGGELPGELLGAPGVGLTVICHRLDLELPVAHIAPADRVNALGSWVAACLRSSSARFRGEDIGMIT
jgi:hypothetical protein